MSRVYSTVFSDVLNWLIVSRSVDQVVPCKMASETRSFNLSSVVSFCLTRRAPNRYTTDVITQSVAAFLQPHTSSPSVSVVSRVMASLMGGDFGSEELDQVLSTQLDALAISPQAKQNIIPALLGIAKLAEVRSQWCVFQSLFPAIQSSCLLMYKCIRVNIIFTADGVRARA